MKRCIFCIFITIAFFLSPLGVYAQGLDITSRNAWGPDEKISKIEESYQQPKRIALVPIQLPEQIWKYSDEEIIKSLYYYFSTRSAFGDIPFHYVVTLSGTIYDTGKFGAYSNLKVNEEEHPLSILILSKNSEISLATVEEVSSLTLELANQYEINPNEIFEYDTKFMFNDSNGVESITLQKRVAENTLESIRSFVSENYSPIEVAYDFDLVEISVPKENIAAGESVAVSITLKNASDRDVFGNSGAGLQLRTSREQSQLYHGDSWTTLRDISILDDNQRFESDSEQTFTFSITAPLAIGSYSEEFDLLYNNVVQVEGITILVNLKNPEGTIIEIQETGTGFLNVRESTPFGDVVAQVTPGDKYLVLETVTGWYKIETIDGKVGWVSSQYATIVTQ